MTTLGNLPSQKTPPAAGLSGAPVGDAPLTPIQQALRNAARNGGFQPVAATPTAPTLPPFMVATPPQPRPAPAPEAMESERSDSPSPSGIVRTITLLLKLSVSGTIVLAIAYVTLHSVIPVVKELIHPGGTSALHDKDAPTFVKAIQQTRLVVAKSDANVAYLNSLVGVDTKGNPLGSAGPAAATPTPPPAGTKAPSTTSAKVTTYAPAQSPAVDSDEAPTPAVPEAPKPVINLRPFQDAVAELKIGGVMGGSSPRILIDGLLVRVGDVADSRHKLVFTGVDAVNHVIFFTNETTHEIFRRYY